MEKRYYIAYGSNLNVRQMRYRCPTAKIIGTSTLKDYRLMFKGSKTGSYLTVEPQKGHSVPVAVWEIAPEDERSLDFYEGFPAFYYKKELTIPVKGIYSGKVRSRNVFVYVMHEERPFGLPTAAYVDACAEGYRFFKFDIGVLLEAIDYSAREVLKWKV